MSTITPTTSRLTPQDVARNIQEYAQDTIRILQSLMILAQASDDKWTQRQIMQATNLLTKVLRATQELNDGTEGNSP